MVYNLFRKYMVEKSNHQKKEENLEEQPFFKEVDLF